MNSKKEYSEKLSEFIAESILEKKGRNIKIINLKNKSDITDYFVIATVDSELQMKAISNWIEKELGDRGLKPKGKEGSSHSPWFVLDYVHVIVHLFKENIRKHYNIEAMWADAPSIEITEKEEHSKK